jgi:hypothetical protein
MHSDQESNNGKAEQRQQRRTPLKEAEESTAILAADESK